MSWPVDRTAFVRVGDSVVDLPPSFAAPLPALAAASPISYPCDECGRPLRSAVFSSASWTLRCDCGRIYPIRWRDQRAPQPQP